MATAIVGGAIANKPRNGGEAWVRLSWLLGLRRLGFDVYFLEVLSDSACVDGDGSRVPFERSVNRAHLIEAVGGFGLRERVAVLDEREQTLLGLDGEHLRQVCAEAEVIFDLSGHLGGLALLQAGALRVYVDLDPGFTQAWHKDRSLGFTVAGYDRYVTVGLNVGSAGCSVPTVGLDWIGTLPPVVIEQWSSRLRSESPFRFSTVARWRSAHGPVSIDGRAFALKHHEFRRLIDLPERAEDVRFELALAIDPADVADLRALTAHGWHVIDAAEHAGSPSAFRDYIWQSCAEFSVAQPVYAQTRSGWFSDRTAAYLAAGRPALVQDTGIDSLPLGEGLLTFSSPAQAVEAARQIADDPAGHGQAALALAEEHLDSDRVLGGLLTRLGIGG